jgi:hypothetical protein
VLTELLCFDSQLEYRFRASYSIGNDGYFLEVKWTELEGDFSSLSLTPSQHGTFRGTNVSVTFIVLTSSDIGGVNL